MEIKVGTIFRSSWGYDQTNIDFYEVTRVMKASVEIRKIAGQQTTGDGWTGKVVPKPGEFIGEPMTKRLKNTYDGNPCIRIESYAHAYLWNGKAEAFTAYA